MRKQIRRRSTIVAASYPAIQWPQVLHDPPLQDPHEPPPDEDVKLDPALNPKDEGSLSTWSLPQSGHFTFAQHPMTSSSNLRPHCLHLYSNMGIEISPLFTPGQAATPSSRHWSQLDPRGSY